MAAAAALAVFTVAWRILAFGGFSNDHYVHLARAQQLLLGDLPVRDFVDPGMPLMYGVSAGAWWLWGGSPGTELLLISAAFALGAVCTVVVAHRLSGSLLMAAGAALLEVLITPRSYSYPKVLLYAAAAWAVAAVIDSPSRQRIGVLAAVAGTAFLFRHDHGVYIGLTAAAAVALAGGALDWRTRARRAAVLAGVAMLVVAPWLLFVSYYERLDEYFASGIEFSRAERRNNPMHGLPRFTVGPREELVRLRPARRPSAVVDWTAETTDAVRRDLEARYGLEPVAISKRQRWEYYGPGMSEVAMRALAADPHVTDVSGFDRIVEWSSWDALRARLAPGRVDIGPGLRLDENAYVWLFYVFSGLPVACAAMAIRRRASGRERWNGESATVGALAVMAVLVNIGLMRGGNLPVWLPDAAVPAVLLGAWAAPVTWNAGWKSPAARLAARTAWILPLGVTVAAVVSVGSVREQVARTGVPRGIEGLSARAAVLGRLWGPHRDAGFTPSSVSQALLPFFGYLQRCTSPQDRLVMTWLYPDVFVMAERGFAGGHVALLDGFYSSAAEQHRTLARLRRESVPFVLMVVGREDGFRASFPLLSAHIDSRYEALTEVPVEGTSVRVLVERDRAARGLDRQTGWPCFT